MSLYLPGSCITISTKENVKNSLLGISLFSSKTSAPELLQDLYFLPLSVYH